MKSKIGLVIVSITIILLLSGLVFLVKMKKDTMEEFEDDYYDVLEDNEYLGSDKMDKYVVEMKVKKYGVITIELDYKASPITVTNFLKLVESKFYDGLTFHRIIEGFMIQGGDPSHNGNGGSSEKIKGEFLANGYNNKISHVRGVISMARASYSYDSASSQFFIVQEDATYLDGNYAAFGHVINGMDIVDKIAHDAKPIDDNGTIEFKEQPVIEYIKLIN